jgi:hypothetical protein
VYRSKDSLRTHVTDVGVEGPPGAAEVETARPSLAKTGFPNKTAKRKRITLYLINFNPPFQMY